MTPLTQHRHRSRSRRRPSEVVVLTESAKTCVTQLEALKQLAIRGATNAEPTQVVVHVDRNIVLLEEWIANVSKGQQTPDNSIVQNANDNFKQLQGRITDAKDALTQRSHLRVLCWSIAPRSKRQEASARVTKALIEIDSTVEELCRQPWTVVVGTVDQQINSAIIQQRDHPTPGAYAKFQVALRSMPISEEQSGTLKFLPIFWDELPRKQELESALVGNPFYPGDGIIYTAAELIRAENVLKAYCDAWSEIVTQVNPAFPSKPPMIRSLADMSKTCLVLKGMERPQLLEHFFRCQKTGVELPLPVAELETILQEDRHHASVFATEQYRVVRRTWNEGGHIDISPQEPLPLRFNHDYTSGSFGTVQCYKDVDSQELFARKEQIGDDAVDHLVRERARLQKVHHRHIVQFVKSYRRGERIGLLLRPAADADLEKLLAHFSSQRGILKPGEEERRLRPVILTAFGCLSHGLCHIHGQKIRHKDIKPNNILYQGSQHVARFLWADFGLAYDFSKFPDSRTFNPSKYSARYAAPENAATDQDVMNAKAAGFDGLDPNQDTDDEREHSATAELLPEDTEKPKTPAHGRSADIFSYGCVFIQILSALVDSKIPQSESPNFAFHKHIAELQDWAKLQAGLLEPADPLRVLFLLAVEMIRYNPRERPKVETVLSELIDSPSPERFFCAACLPEVKAESAAWRAAHESRPVSSRGRTSDESTPGTSGTSYFESGDKEPRSPAPQAHFLSPATATRPRTPLH